MTVFAYMRVSTDGKGQTTDNQRKLLTDAGFAIHIFISEDGVSGSMPAFERPAFAGMVEEAQAGDTVIVTAVDRLGRSTSDVLNVVETFKAKGIKLRVTMLDGVDLTSSTGKLLVTMMAALAEMEKNMLIERTNAGIARSKAEGTKFGAPLTIEPTILRELVDRRTHLSLDKLSVIYGIPRNTIDRNVKTWGGKLGEYAVEWIARKTQYTERKLK